MYNKSCNQNLYISPRSDTDCWSMDSCTPLEFISRVLQKYLVYGTRVLQKYSIQNKQLFTFLTELSIKPADAFTIEVVARTCRPTFPPVLARVAGACVVVHPCKLYRECYRSLTFSLYFSFYFYQ